MSANDVPQVITGIKSITMPGMYPKDSILYLSHTQISGAFAACMVSCAGIKRSIRDLPVTLEAFSRAIKIELNKCVLEGTADKFVGIYSLEFGQLLEIVQRICETEPEIVKLNERNVNVGIIVATECDDDMDLDTPGNFTDLGALSRNVVNEVVISNQLI
jgi:hypothetical protein